MDVVEFLPQACKQRGEGELYYNHGTAEKKIPSEVGRRVESERFDLKLNICIVVHALLCKVLPDNCTCVNTLNADFVFK